MYHKKEIGKQCRPRPDAAECGVWSGSTLFALSSEISTTHDHKNKSDTPYIGNWPVQRTEAEESTPHKWVKERSAEEFMRGLFNDACVIFWFMLLVLIWIALTRYVVGTHLNCLYLFRQFRWLLLRPSTPTFDNLPWQIWHSIACRYVLNLW